MSDPATVALTNREIGAIRRALRDHVNNGNWLGVISARARVSEKKLREWIECDAPVSCAHDPGHDELRRVKAALEQ